MYKDRSPLEVGDLYWHLKESVGKYELVLLRALNFNMHVQLPHAVSLYFVQVYFSVQWKYYTLTNTVPVALPAGTLEVDG